MKLDHLFICCEDARAAEAQLTAFGIAFGTHSFHPGQGTSNCCAYFENAYLELLWPRREDELRSPAVRDLCLWERMHWQQTGASPFGIAFRIQPGEALAPAWSYAAPFLPPGWACLS